MHWLVPAFANDMPQLAIWLAVAIANSLLQHVAALDFHSRAANNCNLAQLEHGLTLACTRVWKVAREQVITKRVETAF